MKSSYAQDRFHWLDITRGFAMLWVFLVHFVERFMGGSAFANPCHDWVPLAARIAELAPLNVDGGSYPFINLLRYVGWLGDQGVQIFLVASGFGLALSALRKNEDFSARKFYSQRLARIFPLWIAAHLLFIACSLFFGSGLSIANWRTWASLFGFRFLPSAMYYAFPAWWYIGVLLQLYAVFPFLFSMLRRWSPLRFMLVVGGSAVLIRLAGLYVFDQYLDWWSRGGFFAARLPEFAFGMAFAKWLMEASPEKVKRLKSPISIAGIAGVYLLGNICSFFLTGMSVAFLLTGAGFFLLVWALFSQKDVKWTHPIEWTGRGSYALYLFHHPVIKYLVPKSLAIDATGKILGLLLATFSISLVGAIVLEKSTNYIVDRHHHWKSQSGIGGSAVRWAALCGIIMSLALAAEITVRQFDPQEVLGWGERPSLEPHDTYGYRLKPNSKTRLRWQSYDYVVEANALGFPGMLYEKRKPNHIYRIMVTGDAFESAEGVSTKDAWPRLLEKRLMEETGVETQVLNLSITGWGPNQYASVIADYAPVYKPDLIIVGFFVNDFFDVTRTNDQFQRAIGFSNIAQTSVQSYIRLIHLRHWLKHLSIPLRNFNKKRVSTMGYFFGNFIALEKNSLPTMTANAELVADRLITIKQTAQKTGSRVLVALVPASVQVSSRDSLKYYPEGIDLMDTRRFDKDQPQRLAMQLCKKLSISYTDLRNPLLEAVEKMPYQPRNMHWTKAGHKIVAEYITGYLIHNRCMNIQKRLSFKAKKVD